jgi:hypothetical protein
VWSDEAGQNGPFGGKATLSPFNFKFAAFALHHPFSSFTRGIKRETFRAKNMRMRQKTKKVTYNGPPTALMFNRMSGNVYMRRKKDLEAARAAKLVNTGGTQKWA